MRRRTFAFAPGPCARHGSCRSRRKALNNRRMFKFSQSWRLQKCGFIILFLLLICSQLRGVEPPVIPVGLDAYRQWERWPYQRIGARAYMRSTYDLRGGNEGADASHFLYQLAVDRNVALDVEGS